MLSARLIALLDDILQGRAPNAGRFCGYCYHPLPVGGQALPGAPDLCPHCAQTGAPGRAGRPGGRSPADWAPVDHIAHAVLLMHRLRRSREALVVRAIAWGGLTLGVVLALLPLAFAGVAWWTVLAFFAILVGFYLLSANLANSLGDALGYRWGQAAVRGRWARFVAERDGPLAGNS